MVSRRQTVKRYWNIARQIGGGPPSYVKILLASLPLACCCGCWRSTPAPTRYQVASSSMFPALLGPTRGATCSACQFNFPVAAETYRPELPTRCERCGGLCDVAEEIQPGQTAELEPLSFDTFSGQNPVHPIRRWELIAFQEPSSGSTQVKRVWGLPGEAIELREGEAWVDGQLLRKSLAELRQLAVPVYDLRIGGSGQWWLSNSNEISQPASLSLQPGQVVRFQLCRPAPVHPLEVPAEQWLEPSPMVDSYSINQGISTALQPVEDCLLSLSLSQPLNGSLTIELRRNERVIRVVLASPDEPTEVRETSNVNNVDPLNGTDQAVATWHIAGQKQIEVGWCDGRLLLESDLQLGVIEVDELELALSAKNTSPSHDLPWESHELFRLEASGLSVITGLKLSRDLYLAPAIAAPPDSDSASESPESLAGYYVLGDNLPVSRDSRQQLGRVSPTQLLGRISPVPAMQDSR